MSRTRQLAILGALVLVGVAIVGWQLRGRTADPAAVRAAASAPTAPVSPASQAPATGSAQAAPRVRRLDPGARAALRAQIQQAKAVRERGAAAGGATATPAPALVAGSIDKEYIRSSVRELIPLLSECYEQGLERTPTLEGKVTVTFTIEGEPGVGGVVSESTIDEAASSLPDAEVKQCIQETMHAIEIEPPSGGGAVTVHYPFEFRTTPPE